MAAFFLPQIPVEHPEEEEALESEYLRAAELTQAERGPRRLQSGVEVEVRLQALRVAERPQPLPSVWLRLRRPPSKNTNAAVAGKLEVLAFLLPYASYDGGPGTPLSASLLISNEIL